MKLKLEVPAEFRPPVEAEQELLDLPLKNCANCPLEGCGSIKHNYRGSISPKLLFVGKAPGTQEQKTGNIFRDRSGRLLEQLLEEAGFNPSEYLLTNGLQCRPPDNREPEKEELEACRENLQAIIDQTKPLYIIPVGAAGLKAVTGKSGIMKLRGVEMDTPMGRVIPILHPEFALKTGAQIKPKNKVDQFEGHRGTILMDLQAIRDKLDGVDHRKEKDYKLIDTPTKVKWLISELEKHEYVACDIETTGLSFYEDKIIGIAFSWAEHQGCYLPIYARAQDLIESKSESIKKRGELILKADANKSNSLVRFWGEETKKIYKIMRYIFSMKNKKWCGWNFKFDQKFLIHHFKLKPFPVYDDGMFMSYLLDENSSNSLKDNTDRYYLDMRGYANELYQYVSQSDLDDEKLAHAPLDVLLRYACGDVDATRRLCQDLYSKISEDEGLHRYYTEFYMPLHHIYVQAELEGVKVDQDWVHTATLQLEKNIKETGEALFKEVGVEFNPNSSQQIMKILFQYEECKASEKVKNWEGNSVYNIPWPLDEKLLTTKGLPSTSEVALKEIYYNTKQSESVNKAAVLIMRYKGYSKQLSTYINGCTAMLDGYGRAHYNFNLIGAVTGRLSAKKIPIQTIPRDPLMRGMYVASPGWKIIEADYSQMELRLAAWYSKDPEMVREFRDGEDCHYNTAMEMFKKAKEKITKEERKLAKSTNFGCFTRSGLISIKDRGLININEVKPGDISADTGTKINYLIKNGQKSFYTLETNQGYSLIVTKSHKVMTNTGLKEVGTLTQKDLLKLSINPAHSMTDPNIPEFQVQQLGNRATPSCMVPDRMSPELGLWLGLWISEGSIKLPSPPRRNYYRGVCFYNQDKDLIYSWKNLTNKLFGIDCDERLVGAKETVARTHSSFLGEWLIKAIGTGDRSSTKKVPDLLFFSTKESKTAFLRGLFEGDGCIRLKKGKVDSKRTQISYKSKSLELCQGIQKLLISYGIACQIQPVRESWSLTIKSCHIDKYMNEIGFISNRKNLRWKPRNNSANPDHFVQFKALRYYGEEEAFDLEIDQVHLYSCNGLQVSNSLYEGGPRTLADSINSRLDLSEIPITVDDAARFQAAWKRRYHGFIKWRIKVHQAALKDKKVIAPLGRVRRLPQVDARLDNENEQKAKVGEALREAGNSLIQGLGSDLAQFALIRIVRRIVDNGLKARFRWSLHDALFFEAPDHEVYQVCQIIQEEMERTPFPDLIVPSELKVFRERWAGSADEGQALIDTYKGLEAPEEAKEQISLLTEAVKSQKMFDSPVRKLIAA